MGYVMKRLDMAQESFGSESLISLKQAVVVLKCNKTAKVQPSKKSLVVSQGPKP